ncbi:MAG: DUF1549 domain-containing protein, partial [Planctomycetes bacterium]|nr:DUF1549 domain-containing protein [Planctomycetota bacterium]
MRNLTSLFPAFVAASVLGSLAAADEPLAVTGELTVEPATIKLTHRRQPHSIIVSAKTKDGLSVDLTSEATWKIADETIARVNLLGWVQPVKSVKSGSTTVEIQAAGKTASVKVEVALADQAKPYNFRHDIMPVLSKGGCNTGACHGYSLGKNGFKLSLRGSDPAPDFVSLTDEFFERRINRHNPPASLLITKPLGDVPHQGGVRFDHGSLLHEMLLGWVGEGAPSNLEDPVRLVSTRIYPTSAVLKPGMQHQMQLLATYSDGSVRDVTRLGIFEANTQTVAGVDDEGLVTSLELGETAIVARFERVFATANIIVLNPNPDFQPTPLPENLVDRHILQKLNELKIKPSGLIDDAGYLRRVSLDLIGLQPTPEEVLAFLNDKDPQKRAKIVETLMKRPEFTDWWTLKWGDLLQNSRNRLSAPAVFAFREWIRSAVAQNMALDQFRREILTIRGGVLVHPAPAHFAVSKGTGDPPQRALPQIGRASWLGRERIRVGP